MNDVLKEAQSINNFLEKMNITEATFKNGNYYNHDINNETKRLVTEGIIVEESNS